MKPAELRPGEEVPGLVQDLRRPARPDRLDCLAAACLGPGASPHAGFIVFHGDPRAASGKGAVVAWTVYKHLGVHELEDIETAINWLSQNPWVDAARIGMSGHCYGGFMTAYALTHCKLFAAGIAGAPVTDWRDYDSDLHRALHGRCRRRMRRGTTKTSVVKAAKNLHGRLLLLHGLIDDNVHLQNSSGSFGHCSRRTSSLR